MLEHFLGPRGNHLGETTSWRVSEGTVLSRVDDEEQPLLSMPRGQSYLLALDLDGRETGQQLNRQWRKRTKSSPDPSREHGERSELDLWSRAGHSIFFFVGWEVFEVFVRVEESWTLQGR